jgi:hypothetical protein
MGFGFRIAYIWVAMGFAQPAAAVKPRIAASKPSKPLPERLVRFAQAQRICTARDQEVDLFCGQRETRWDGVEYPRSLRP